jgi:soluble P-type ATPase
MNFTRPFKKFLKELNSKFPTYPSKLQDGDIDTFHAVFVDHSLEILKKDPVLWQVPRVVFGHDLSELWKDESSHSIIWGNMQGCLISSMFHGKLEDKLKGNIPLLSTMLKSVIGERSELDDILSDESKQSSITDFLEFLKETKMAGLALSIFERLDFSQLDVDISSFDDIPGKMAELQNNPAMQKIQSDLKALMEEKSRTGEFTKEIVMRDLESIKVKVQELFGNAFNDILGTRKAEVSSEVITGNTPEARRARMIARMKRKLKENK